jgi:two-component system chemotaxis response regulator CheB
MLVVQHMPQGFTAEFAQSLDRICPLTVEEAKDGDILKPGRVLIAPGNRHMRVEKRPLASVVRIIDDPPVNGHRPSVDVLFESVARVFGNRSMAVIMTGMGKDGAQNIGLIHQAGGLTIGQDEKTCVVYGMPKAAFEYGFLSMQVPLPELAKKISSLAKEYR